MRDSQDWEGSFRSSVTLERSFWQLLSHLGTWTLRTFCEYPDRANTGIDVLTDTALPVPQRTTGRALTALYHPLVGCCCFAA